MSVIGFDIGNESCVIAAAKRGGVDVLLNDEAKRETPSVVSFGEKQRSMGSAGAAFATANPKSTISQIKRLVGKVYKEVEEELKLLPFMTSEGPRGGILIELEYLKKKWTFTPVEILGMLFKHLKQIAEKNLESSVVDCVIGIPSYFSDLQRRLYLDAAQLAGLKPLRVMHDGTAIALGYGMYKTDLSDSGPTYVMFVDIGHCDTQVTLAAFEQGGMNILAHSFDENLGGRDFDEVLFKHFAARFNEKHKIDIYSNARASVRLRASCEKVKKVLSANAEAPLSIECLIGDTDVRGIITREEFENLSSKLLERVIVPCRKALKDSRLRVDELYTIELVGSGSRIPAITRILASFLKKEPTRTLNASECVARGCALLCAKLSPTQKVREYKITESFPYTIIIPSPQGDCVVFPKGSSYPSHKSMKHTRNIPFYLQVAYIKERAFPAGISHIVGHFGIGSPEHSNAEKANVEFNVKLNGDGIVKIDSATILEDTRYGYNVWKRILMADSYMLKLSTTGNVDVSTTDEELDEAKEKEKMLTEQDIKVEKIKDQRNTLESFVYDTRSKLSGAYKSFASDLEKEELTKNLQETEERLYEDSDDESEQDYTGKLKDLKKLLEPIENRYMEEKAIAEATKTLETCIAKYRSSADSLPAGKRENVKNLCTEAERLLNDLSKKHLSPTTLLNEISRVTAIVDGKCKNIIRSESEAENAKAKAAKHLQDCIAHYCLVAESLPAVNKEKVKNMCTEVEQWFKDLSQKQLSPKTFLTDINRATESLERECESIIRSKSSSSRHEKLGDLVKRDQAAESNQPVAKAVKPLQDCIARYYSLAESLPVDKKEKIMNACNTAEKWLNGRPLKTLLTDVNKAIEHVESKCEIIINSQPSSSRHKEQPLDSDQKEQPVDSDQRDQTVESEQLVNSENAIMKMKERLQACFQNYYLLAESLPADKKEQVIDVCERAENWLNGRLEDRASPKTWLSDINEAIGFVESNCEMIINFQTSSPKHEEPEDSDQRDQPVDSDQSDQPVDSDQRDQLMDMDQTDQHADSDQTDEPMDTDQRDTRNDSKVHK